MSAIIKGLQSLAGLSTLIYLLGWLLALIGVALLHNDCSDSKTDRDGYVGEGLFGAIEGDSCRKGFRFPWTILALSTIPVGLALVHTVRPHLVPRGSSALFAVLAVLHILMANEFFNIYDLSGNGDRSTFAQLALAGFAIMAAAALLAMIAEALIDPTKSRAEYDAKHGRTGGHGSDYEVSKGRHHHRDEHLVAERRVEPVTVVESRPVDPTVAVAPVAAVPARPVGAAIPVADRV